MNIMNIMHILKYLTLLVPSICVSIPMEPFLFADMKPTNYIIENDIQESKVILQYEEENTVMDDIKDNQFSFYLQKHQYKKYAAAQPEIPAADTHVKEKGHQY